MYSRLKFLHFDKKNLLHIDIVILATPLILGSTFLRKVKFSHLKTIQSESSSRTLNMAQALEAVPIYLAKAMTRTTLA